MWYRIMLLLVVIGLCAAPLNVKAPAASTASQAKVNCCGPEDPPNPPPPPPTA